MSKPLNLDLIDIRDQSPTPSTNEGEVYLVLALHNGKNKFHYHIAHYNIVDEEATWDLPQGFEVAYWAELPPHFLQNKR